MLVDSRAKLARHPLAPLNGAGDAEDVLENFDNWS